MYLIALLLAVTDIVKMIIFYCLPSNKPIAKYSNLFYKASLIVKKITIHTKYYFIKIISVGSRNVCDHQRRHGLHQAGLERRSGTDIFDSKT